MALSDELTNRLSTQKLVDLTNPDTTGATTVDTTRRDAAIADVEGEFRTIAGVVYDNTDNRHVKIAVKGVVLYLRSYAKNAKVNFDGFEKELKALRKVTANNRLLPKTNSVKTVKQDIAKVRDFDLNSEFRNIIPDAMD